MPNTPSRPREEQPRLLADILRALPEKELNALISRLGIRVDPAKRLDTASQVSRALVSLPELRDPSRLPQACVELLHRVAETRGSLIVTAIPPALEPLAARGLMFARGTEAKGAYELVLPPAFLVQLRTWEGENPRSLRALLSQASFETTSSIAAHYLGRPATPPIALSLETAWEVLSDRSKLAQEIERLPPTERRVLDSVERDGGEVDTEELLELEKEPLRLRSASGATPSRRGVGCALERRGLLIPLHPNRHVVPAEVAAVIGASRHAERARRRDQVKSFVLSGDHAPRRARFAADPAPLAGGLALVSREAGSEIRAQVGTPKSLVQKLAVRFGRDTNHVALIVALSRAVGLWDPSALNASQPPGALTLGEVNKLLFDAWRRGGAWDEARPEPEVLRLSHEHRDSSPVGVMREIVLEALIDLRDGGWVPWESLAGYIKSDDRIRGLSRLLRRWADRVNIEFTEPMEIARRIVHESLPGLGMVDLGDEAAMAEGGEASSSTTLRLTPRGRALLDERPSSAESSRSKFLDTHVLRVGSNARISVLLAVAPFVEVARATDMLDLIVAPQTLARALSAGYEADALRQRIEALAPLPESLSKTLAQASIILGRATFTSAGGFLWVEDPDLREMLRTRRATSELFVDPSPPAGLLVVAGVDVERLSRRCRTIGIEVVADGQVVRARSIPPGAKLTPSPMRATKASKT
ncbi:MAG: hypothetical protein ABI461_14975 [Polyangiaceae bacterium]